VNTGVYQAEYGRAAGGVINSVTRAAATSCMTAYFSDRESAWGAYNPYTTNTVAVYANGGTVPSSFVTSPTSRLIRADLGFNAGGALIQNKLFWSIHTISIAGSSGTAKANSPSSFFTQPDAPVVAGAHGHPQAAPLPILQSATGIFLRIQEHGCACTRRAGVYAGCREGLSSYSAGTVAYATGLGVLLTDLGSVPRAGYQEVNMPKLDCG